MDGIAAQRVLGIIETFRSVDRLSTGSIAMFVTVAMDPGKSASEYAERTGIMAPVAYRVLAELGEITRRQDREVGLGLIQDQTHPEDGRGKLYRLTPRGEILWKKVLQIAGTEDTSQEGA